MRFDAEGRQLVSSQPSSDVLTLLQQIADRLADDRTGAKETWTDDDGGIFRLVSEFDLETNSWLPDRFVDLNDAPYTPGANPRPYGVDKEKSEKCFEAIATGTGYAIGDELTRTRFRDTSSGAITLEVWENESQGTTLPSVPTLPDLTPCKVGGGATPTRVLYRDGSNPNPEAAPLLGYFLDGEVYPGLAEASEQVGAIAGTTVVQERIVDVISATLASDGDDLGFEVDTAFAQKMVIKGACTGHAGDLQPIVIDFQKSFAGQAHLAKDFPIDFIFLQDEVGEIVVYGDEIPQQFTLVRSDPAGASSASVALEITLTRTISLT